MKEHRKYSVNEFTILLEEAKKIVKDSTNSSICSLEIMISQRKIFEQRMIEIYIPDD